MIVGCYKDDKLMIVFIFKTNKYLTVGNLQSEYLIY